MRVFFVLVYIAAIALNLSWAQISYDNVKANSFTAQNGMTIESNIAESLKTTKNVFASNIFKSIVNAGITITKIGRNTVTAGLKIAPIVNQLMKVTRALTQILASETEWQGTFEHEMDKKIRELIASERVNSMKSTMGTVTSFIETLKDSSIEDPETISVNVLLLSTFDSLLNQFDQYNSLLKRFALVGAPILIQLSLMVAIFEPIAKTIIPNKINQFKLSCKARDLLFDYRPFVLSNRLEKLNTNLEFMVSVKNAPYNSNGYNQTNMLFCEEGCPENREKNGLCLTDKFGEKKYSVNSKTELTNCRIGYGQHIRHLLEKTFPFEELSRICEEQAKKPSGFGWVTIKIKELRALYKETDDHNEKCDDPPAFLKGFSIDSTKCDSYVKLYINGREVGTTDIKQNTDIYNVELFFTSGPEKINRNSIIKIEVWDHDEWSKHDLILRQEGSIDSFIDFPIRRSVAGHFYGQYMIGDLPPNYLEVDVIWQDAREEDYHNQHLLSSTQLNLN